MNMEDTKGKQAAKGVSYIAGGVENGKTPGEFAAAVEGC
jgi:hypothetical protein